MVRILIILVLMFVRIFRSLHWVIIGLIVYID